MVVLFMVLKDDNINQNMLVPLFAIKKFHFEKKFELSFKFLKRICHVQFPDFA